MIVFERRAANVLFNYLKTNEFVNTFILPANVCPIIPAVLIKAEVPFEFIDISPDSFCIDEERTLDKIAKAPGYYSGIIFVRTYGISSSFRSFFQRMKSIKPDISIIDDCCLCPPSFEDKIDSHTDLKLFSTGYAKYVDIGMGGYGILQDGASYTAQNLSHNPQDLKKLDALFKSRSKAKLNRVCRAAWLDIRKPEADFDSYKEIVLKEKKRIKKLKNEINSIYYQAFPEEIYLKPAYHNWRFNICVNNNKETIKQIFNHGLFASSHYYPYSLLFNSADAPVSEWLYSRIINLFNDRYISADKARRISEIVVKYAKYSA